LQACLPAKVSVDMDLIPLHFIGEPIKVHFSRPPALEKIPGPPDSFLWRGTEYPILEVLSEWHDYRRRGRMARNMQPKHAATAARRGSWGVGRDYYRVRTPGGRIFDLYYDRAPKDADQRKGGWFLDKELAAAG
jgi:hypothetical protein